MKKLILMSLIMLIGTFSLTTENIEKANAEDNVVNVVPGYITNNLVQDNAIILNDETNAKINESFELADDCILSFDDSFMRYIMGNETKTLPNGGTYVPASENYNYTDAKNASHIVTRNQVTNVQIFNSFSNVKYTLNYRFINADYTKPLELMIPINLKAVESFLTVYYKGVQNFSMPLLSVNGDDYLFLNLKATKAGNKITYATNNARVYLTYDEEGLLGDYIFAELPATEYLETINIFDCMTWSHNAPGLNKQIKILSDNLINAINSPFYITDIDFKNGKLNVLTSNSTYVGSEQLIRNGNYNILTSIVFNGTTTLYTKPTGKLVTNFREEEYEFYSDSDFSFKFTYDSNNEFAKQLRESEDNVEFNLTKMNYTTKKIDENNEEITVASDFVDCGTYYAFKKISKEQMHIANFNGVYAKNAFYTRLAFNFFDNISQMNLQKINALWFRYKIPQTGVKHSLSITGSELTDSIHGGESQNPVWAFTSPLGFILDRIRQGNNTFSKQMTIGTFWLSGMRSTDYIQFDWSESPDLKESPLNEMFILYTNADVEFEDLISCVYYDKEGDIINATTPLADSESGVTVLIQDGKATLINVDGSKLDLSINDKGDVVDVNNNSVEFKPTITKPSGNNSVISKVLRVILIFLIIAFIAFIISKIGPTLAIAFTNGRNNRKRHKRR